jgi:hypothetical protein
LSTIEAFLECLSDDGIGILGGVLELLLNLEKLLFNFKMSFLESFLEVLLIFNSTIVYTIQRKSTKNTLSI